MRIRYKKNTPEILEASGYVVQRPTEVKGLWRRQFGDKERVAAEKRLELEIGAGRGRFLCDMAVLHPTTYFVGDEKVQTILARASERIKASLGDGEPLRNALLIDTDAQNLCDVFEPGEIDRIYLNFSDPWPKKKHAKRRLTSEKFLKVYEILLAGKGDLCLKTDNDDFYSFSLEELGRCGWTVLEQTDDLHHSRWRGANVMTEYETNFSSRGKNIHYLRAVKP